MSTVTVKKRGWAVIHNGNSDSPLIKYLNDIIKSKNGQPLQGDRMGHYYGVDKDGDVFCSYNISGSDIDVLSFGKFKETFGIEVKEYSVSYQTVDIAVLDKRSNSTRVLLGKRKHEDAYRFIGGFVDVEDSSLEQAAKRELEEECGLKIETTECKYIGSFRVDDPRYKDGKDKIMTALFYSVHLTGEPVAGDDIHEVHWFELGYDIPIVKEHIPLLKSLIKFVNKNL